MGFQAVVLATCYLVVAFLDCCDLLSFWSRNLPSTSSVYIITHEVFVGRFEQNVSEVACRYFAKSGDLSEYCKRELGLFRSQHHHRLTILSFTTKVTPAPTPTLVRDNLDMVSLSLT